MVDGPQESRCWVEGRSVETNSGEAIFQVNDRAALAAGVRAGRAGVRPGCRSARSLSDHDSGFQVTSAQFTSSRPGVQTGALTRRDRPGQNGPVDGPTIRTERLTLRRWTNEDRGHLSTITADPVVMRYRMSPLSRIETDALIDETEASFDRIGIGLWAAERIEDGRLLGFIGFSISEFDAPFCPAVDIGVDPES